MIIHTRIHVQCKTFTVTKKEIRSNFDNFYQMILLLIFRKGEITHETNNESNLYKAEHIALLKNKHSLQKPYDRNLNECTT